MFHIKANIYWPTLHTSRAWAGRVFHDVNNGLLPFPKLAATRSSACRYFSDWPITWHKHWRVCWELLSWACFLSVCCLRLWNKMCCFRFLSNWEVLIFLNRSHLQSICAEVKTPASYRFRCSWLWVSLHVSRRCSKLRVCNLKSSFSDLFWSSNYEATTPCFFFSLDAHCTGFLKER